MRGITPFFVIFFCFAQTNGMKWILFGSVLGVAFVMFLLFFPFLVSAYFDVDANKKIGNYCIKFCGIKIICGYAKLEGTKIEYYNERAWLVGNKKMSEIVPVFVYILLSALDIFSVDIRFVIGSEDNPSYAGIASGLALVTLGCLYGYFKTKNHEASFKKRVAFLTDRDLLKVELCSYVGVSFFNVIKSFVLARIEKSKSVQTKVGVKNEQHN